MKGKHPDNYNILKVDEDTYIRFESISCFKVRKYDEQVYSLAIIADGTQYNLVYNDVKSLFKTKETGVSALKNLMCKLSQDDSWEIIHDYHVGAGEAFYVFDAKKFLAFESMCLSDKVISGYVNNVRGEEA